MAMAVVLGTMTIGRQGLEGIRISKPEDFNALLDLFRQYGHTDVDTARLYGAGTSEEFLAAAHWERRGLRVDTKLYPSKGSHFEWISSERYTLQPDDVRAGLDRSLAALKTDKVHAFYLHGPEPDRSTPFADTLREVDKLYREGRFDVLGVSNFQAWEVAQMCEICKKNGWIAPSIYQGVYNAYHRSVEAELFPCLRFYGLSFYAYNPLAGGFLTDRYTRGQEKVPEGGRFDPTTPMGSYHRSRYWNEPNFAALDILRPVAQKHGLSVNECALRWMNHHSAMKSALGDAVIIGTGSVNHLKENLESLAKGPLPEEVVSALDAGWEHTRARPLIYWL